MTADCPSCKKNHAEGEGAVLVSHAEVSAAWANWLVYTKSVPDLHNFMKFTGWCAYASGTTNRADLSVYLSPEHANRIRWMGGTHGVTLLKAYAAKYAKEAT